MTPKDVSHEYNQKIGVIVSLKAVQIEQRKPFVIPKLSFILHQSIFLFSNISPKWLLNLVY